MSDKRIRREVVVIRLNPTAITELDRLAAARDVSRSQVVRDLLRLGLDAWTGGKRP